jgi:protein kinase A
MNETAFFSDVLEHRRDAWQSTVLNQSQLDFEKNDKDNMPSERVYQRSTVGERVILEEFKTLSVLGRGTFAKVYLVYLPNSETKFYAMKSMRKDVILDRASVQSINLERLIMLQVNHPFLVSM